MFTFTHTFEFACQLVETCEKPHSGALPLGWLLDRFRFYHTEQAKLDRALLAAANEQQQRQELEVRLEKECSSSKEFLGVIESEWSFDIQQGNQKCQSLESELKMVRQAANMEQQQREMEVAHLVKEAAGFEEVVGSFTSGQYEKVHKAEEQCKMLASELEEARKAAAREKSQQASLLDELVSASHTIAQEIEQHDALASELEKTREVVAKKQQQCEVLQLELEKENSNIDILMQDVESEWAGDLEKAEVEQKRMEHRYLAQIEQLKMFLPSPRSINGDTFEDKQCSDSVVTEIMV